jgi:RHS repeat-associated protein
MVTDTLGQETTYTFDEVGNKLTQTDPNGHTKTWSYDDMGRVIRHALAGGQFETFTYTVNGSVETHTDFNGHTTSFDYDVCCGRLLTKTFPDGSTVAYTYTGTGKRESVTDARGVTTYAYDLRDRLIEETRPDGSTIDYTYDAKGNRTSVTTASGTVTYGFDELNRLELVTDPDGAETATTYDAAGNRHTQTQPAGTVTTYTYDSLHRLTGLENRKADGTVLTSYSYTLGPAGNRTRVVEHSGRQVDYAYDGLYRLTEEAISDPVNGDETIAYTYDAFGNRLTKTAAAGATTYTYDTNDRLITENGPAGTTTHTYDANGNTIAKDDGTAAVTYAYDFENRLIEVSNGVTTTTYAYDADGIRVAATTDGGATQYVVDKNRPYAQVLEERDGAGSLTVSYVYGDDLISQDRSGIDRYYLYDGQLSTRGLTSDLGDLTDTYTYDAFGLLIDQAGSSENSYLYTGEQYDPNAGFYYLRARYYDQGVGRFSGEDAWSGDKYDPRTLHKYAYVCNDPINHFDPSGRYWMWLSSLWYRGRYTVVAATPAMHSLWRAKHLMRRLTVAPAKDLLRGLVNHLRAPNVAYQVHHLIPKAYWQRCAELRKIFKYKNDIPVVLLEVAEHQMFTTPLNNALGRLPSGSLTLNQVLKAMEEVYGTTAPYYLNEIYRYVVLNMK